MQVGRVDRRRGEQEVERRVAGHLAEVARQRGRRPVAVGGVLPDGRDPVVGLAVAVEVGVRDVEVAAPGLRAGGQVEEPDAVLAAAAEAGLLVVGRRAAPGDDLAARRFRSRSRAPCRGRARRSSCRRGRLKSERPHQLMKKIVFRVVSTPAGAWSISHFSTRRRVDEVVLGRRPASRPARCRRPGTRSRSAGVGEARERAEERVLPGRARVRHAGSRSVVEPQLLDDAVAEPRADDRLVARAVVRPGIPPRRPVPARGRRTRRSRAPARSSRRFARPGWRFESPAAAAVEANTAVSRAAAVATTILPLMISPFVAPTDRIRDVTPRANTSQQGRAGPQEGLAPFGQSP